MGYGWGVLCVGGAGGVIATIVGYAWLQFAARRAGLVWDEGVCGV